MSATMRRTRAMPAVAPASSANDSQPLWAHGSLGELAEVSTAGIDDGVGLGSAMGIASCDGEANGSVVGTCSTGNVADGGEVTPATAPAGRGVGVGRGVGAGVGLGVGVGVGVGWSEQVTTLPPTPATVSGVP